MILTPTPVVNSQVFLAVIVVSAISCSLISYFSCEVVPSICFN